ncbi:MAG: D-aminoacyl-tRNA deacylase [Eubacteriales bacterium]
MRVVIQRVHSSSVTADGVPRGRVGQGLLLLLGVGQQDGERDAQLLADKILKLRIFPDQAGKMNHSVLETGGSVTVVPNFTLYADYRRGNRPDYQAAAAPEVAKRLFDYFVQELQKKVPQVLCGVFGADMRISVECDGPVTIVMDSELLQKRERV